MLAERLPPPQTLDGEQDNDYRSRGLRDHVLIPLYPLAEWLAAHWWLVLYEVQAPGREDYERRHNLRFGREGFALPDLLRPSDCRRSAALP